MPLAIMKLAIDAVTTTTVTPVNTKFFSVTTGDVAAGATLTIDTAQFFDDSGNTTPALPVLNPGDSTTKLYINGVLQMDGIYVYTPGAKGVGSLVITIPQAGSILEGSPIVLEIANYTPTANTDIAT